MKGLRILVNMLHSVLKPLLVDAMILRKPFPHSGETVSLLKWQSDRRQCRPVHSMLFRYMRHDTIDYGSWHNYLITKTMAAIEIGCGTPRKAQMLWHTTVQ